MAENHEKRQREEQKNTQRKKMWGGAKKRDRSLTPAPPLAFGPATLAQPKGWNHHE